MALYRHVRDKDDLLDGLADVVLREIEPPRRRPDGAELRGQVMAARAVMVRHPWAPRVLIERGTAGPAALDQIEAVLATLFGAGFSIDLAHHSLHVLSSRIFGFSQDLFDDSPRGREPGPMAPMDLYPNVGRMAQAASHEGGLGYCDDDVEFAFGLDLILDGLEQLRG